MMPAVPFVHDHPLPAGYALQPVLLSSTRRSYSIDSVWLPSSSRFVSGLGPKSRRGFIKPETTINPPYLYGITADVIQTHLYPLSYACAFPSYELEAEGVGDECGE